MKFRAFLVVLVGAVLAVIALHEFVSEASAQSDSGWSVQDCELGYVGGGGTGAGAGENWVWVDQGGGGTWKRWGDFNDDGVRGDLQMCQGGECVTVYFDNTLVCQVVAGCDDGGGGDGGGNGGNGGSGGGNGGGDGGDDGGGSGGGGGGCSGPDCDAPPTCDEIQVYDEGVSCDVSCNGMASGAPACLDVTRYPYPRGLVSVPNIFTVNGPLVQEGGAASCRDPQGEFPLHRNRSVRVDFRMRTDIPPAWTFDERPWNIARGVTNEAFGFIVEHTYDTASYSTTRGDKPYNGPSLTGELLSSYQTEVHTWWRAVLVRSWDQYGWDVEYERREVCVDEDCTSTEWRDVEVSREYVFRGHMVVEEPLDLRAFGWPTPDLFSRHAWDSRQEPLPPYTCQIIPTPIIESQSLLTSSP